MGNINSLKHCWDTTYNLGPKFGYYPEEINPWLIIKEDLKEKAKDIFIGSAVQLFGRGHLIEAIGKTYKENTLVKNANLGNSYISMKYVFYESKLSEGNVSIFKFTP